MIDQVGIAFTGVVAIFLTQSKHESRRRYACLFGIAAQPFWLYSAYQASQWGILFMSFFYGWAWLKGVHMHWFTKGKTL